MVDDLDLKQLAEYLHLDLKQVRRMAERGKVPGRRTGDGWVFSEAEIHHWLEERILESDVEERVRLEEALERRKGPRETQDTSVEALLPLEAISVPLLAKTRTSVVDEMTRLAARTGYLWDPEKMAEAVRQREELYPTAVEGGVALLHPRRPMQSILGRPMLAFGRTARGVPFGEVSGGLTDLFFLILSVDDRGHLRTLARLGRLVSDPALRDELRQANTPEQTREILVRHE